MPDQISPNRQFKLLSLASASEQGWVATAFYFTLFLGVAVLVKQQMDWYAHASKTQLNTSQKVLAVELENALEAASEALKQALITYLNNPEQKTNWVKSYQILDYDQSWQLKGEEATLNKWVVLVDRFLSRSEPAHRFYEAISRQRLTSIILIEQQGFAEINRRSVFRLHILDINSDILLSEHLTDPIKRQLKQDVFTLTRNDQLVFSSVASPPEHKAELALPLMENLRVPLLERSKGRLVFQNPPGNQFAETPSQPKHGKGYKDSYEDIVSGIRLHRSSPNTPPDFVLHLFHPEQPLQLIADRQRYRNTLISSGVLVLLTLTAVMLFRATRRAQKLRRLEREFIASMNHELRTPLTVIRSAADNLSEGIVNQSTDINRYGKEILKQSQRLERMIQSTLYFSRESSTCAPCLSEVEPESFFREVIGPLQQLCGDQNTLLYVDYQLSGARNEAQLVIDATAVRLVIENLVMNALIHARPLEGQQCIWVEIGQDGEELSLWVSDNGPGIAKQDQRRVFEAFVRGWRSEAEQRPGSGLGLNLIQKTVNRLGGQVTLESPYINPVGIEQQGAQFLVILPISVLPKGNDDE